MILGDEGTTSKKLCLVSAKIQGVFEIQCLKIAPREEHWQGDCFPEVQTDFRVVQNVWSDPQDTFTKKTNKQTRVLVTPRAF